MSAEPIHIPLTQGYAATIDAADADLAQFKWHAKVHAGGIVYAARNVRGPDGQRKTQKLHRVVLERSGGSVDGVMVDHVNGDGLDCRRANLRAASCKENSRNRVGSRKDNLTSPYLGVSWNSSNRKYSATIGGDGKVYHLGYFLTAEAANERRLEEEKCRWGVQPRRVEAHGCGQ
jgi:hypothetical protein